MGWFSSVWEGVKSVGRTVTQVVKKVYDLCTGESAVDAYDKLEKVISKINTEQREKKVVESAPDFYGAISTNQLEKQISEQEKKLLEHDSQFKYSQKLMAVQIELTRLRSSADLIDRSMKNVKIHASSLSVHYQNMRNINGLVDDVNDLRHGLKAVISTMNHNANVMAQPGVTLRKIEGIDIDKKDGAISLVAAYDAFDRTRDLLRSEVIELSGISTKHLKDINQLKVNAANLGGEMGNQIISFLDQQIIPIIKRAESAGILLKSEVSQLPAAVREENGSLVFENGSIKLEDVQ